MEIEYMEQELCKDTKSNFISQFTLLNFAMATRVVGINILRWIENT